MKKLELYIKENPNETLDVGMTVLGNCYIRPINWAGIWKENKLLNGKCLAYFNSKEEAENILIELGYEQN